LAHGDSNGKGVLFGGRLNLAPARNSVVFLTAGSAKTRNWKKQARGIGDFSETTESENTSSEPQQRLYVKLSEL
jgi:hypothetical protein